MQKKIFVMAVLAVLCSALPAFSAGTCQDWIGVWDFTYDDNTTTNICFDNTTVTSSDIQLCDNDSAANCTCIDNVTSKNFCVDNTTFTQCDNDSVQDCVCVPNPFYIDNSVKKGTQEVVIDDVQEDVNEGVTLDCLAMGQREDGTPIMIAQPDNATLQYAAYKLIPLGTYLYYEAEFGPDVATKPFSQILSDNFTGTAFAAREDYNPLGLVNGTRTGDLCQLRIFPNTVRQIIKFIIPIYPFVMIADRDGDFEFTRPIRRDSIDWGTDNIVNILNIAVTKKILVGFAFVRPFKLETEELQVKVKNADNDTCYGTIDIKALGG